MNKTKFSSTLFGLLITKFTLFHEKILFFNLVVNLKLETIIINSRADSI